MASNELRLRIRESCHPFKAAYEREQKEAHLKEIRLAPMPAHPQPGCNELVIGTSIGATEADMKSRTVVPAIPMPKELYDKHDKRLIDEFANESGIDGFDEMRDDLGVTEGYRNTHLK